jgi:hypothetical protein
LVEELNQENVADYILKNNIEPIETTFSNYASNRFNCLPFEYTQPINSNRKRDNSGNLIEFNEDEDLKKEDKFIYLDLDKIHNFEKGLANTRNQLLPEQTNKEEKVSEYDEVNNINKPLKLIIQDGVYTYIIFKCKIKDKFIFLYEKVEDINELLTKHNNYLNRCDNKDNILVYVAGEFIKNDNNFIFNFASGTFMLEQITPENRPTYIGLITNAFPMFKKYIHFTEEDTETFIKDDSYKIIRSNNPLYQSHYKNNSTTFKTKDDCKIFKDCKTYCNEYSMSRFNPKKPTIHRQCKRSNCYDYFQDFFDQYDPQDSSDQKNKGGKAKQTNKNIKKKRKQQKTRRNKKKRKSKKKIKNLKRKTRKRVKRKQI